MAPDQDDVPAGEQRATNRLELFATVMIAMATVLTAWSAFQSTKWGGVQANSYASAGAARTESAKESTLAGQLSVVDVTTFEQWIAAYADERRLDPQASMGPDGEYVPDPTQLSGFLFTRFRDEFKPAVQAWLDLRPLENAKAPPTPFAMKEYVVADASRADRLTTKADRLAAEARAANQRGDNYVLATVVFATVLFFAGISSKFDNNKHRATLLIMGGLMMLAGIVVLATFPVEL